MHRAILFVCISLISTTITTARAEYTLVWAEEFDSTSPNSARWTGDNHIGVVRSARDIGYYTDRPSNVSIKDGVLHITAQQESYDLAAFTTGRLHTYGKRAFTLGRISVRAKIPLHPGLRPQVSLLPAELTYGSWPASGEIDLIDTVSGVLTCGLHFGGSGPRGEHTSHRYPTDAISGSEDDFHVYTVEWQPYEIRWYIDDQLAAFQHHWSSASAPYPAPFDQPFYLALGLTVEKPEALQRSEWPQSMQIDWIRVYQAQGNHAPTVKLIRPIPDSTFPAARRVTLSADATDPDGNLAGVEFYADQQRLTIDRDAPYAYDWPAPDGCYNIIARAVDGDGFARAANAFILVGGGCPPTPFHGQPAVIPGRIEAEDFDASKLGDAYYDTDASNNGGAYRPKSGVDIQRCSEGGYNIGWLIQGEWVRYTVNVETAGKYDIRCRVGSPQDTGRIRLELDDQNISGSIAIPKTGDWQAYTDVVVRGVQLSAGVQVLKLIIEQENLNLDYIEFSRSSDR